MIIPLVILSIILSIGVAAYITREKIKSFWKQNKRKIVGVVVAGSTIAAGGAMIPFSEGLNIEDYLITSIDMYEDLGFDVSRIKNPIIYERHVLTEGNLPIAFKFNILKTEQQVDSQFITVEKLFKMGFRDINLTTYILTQFDYIKEVPVYAEREVKRIVNDTNSSREQVVVDTETYISHYEEIKDYYYDWVKLESIRDLHITQHDILIINIQGKWKAELCRRAVDIVPTINLESKSIRYCKYAWWESNWDYRKPITVSNKIEGYQTFLNISKTSGTYNCSGHCNNNFSDLRFAVDNGSLIPYWIESYVSGDYAHVWVNNKWNDTTLYMYYGNSDATTTSDASDTFLRYDDFEDYDIGDVPDTDKYWELSVENNAKNYFKAASNPSGSGKVMQGHSTSTDQTTQYLYMNLSALNIRNVSVEYSLRMGLDVYHYWNINQKDGTLISLYAGAASGDDLTYHDGSSYEDFNPSKHMSTNTWYNFKHNIYSNDIIIDGTSHVGGLRASWASDLWRYGITPFRQRNVDVYLDDFRVRRFTSGAEPTYSFGSEETKSYNPINSHPYPTHQATDIPITLSYLNITVNHPYGHNMNITFRTNASGTWQVAQTNSSVSNGTYYCLNTTWITGYDTTYWWNVSTNDGHGGWANDTYNFSTGDLLDPPILSGESPTNNSIDQDCAFTWNITIEDPYGNTFNWTIECSNGQSNSSNDDINGSKKLELSGLASNTTYTVWVNATNGWNATTSEWFTFTTEISTIDFTLNADTFTFNVYYGESAYSNEVLNIEKDLKCSDLASFILYGDDLTSGARTIPITSIGLEIDTGAGWVDWGYLNSGGYNLGALSDSADIRLYVDLACVEPYDTLTYNLTTWYIDVISATGYLNSLQYDIDEVAAYATENEIPMIVSMYPTHESSVVAWDGKVTLSITVEDPEGDQFNVSIYEEGFFPIGYDNRLYESAVGGNGTFTVDVRLHEPTEEFEWSVIITEVPQVGCDGVNNTITTTGGVFNFSYILAYNETVRRGAYDYFTWLGNETTSAEDVRQLLGFTGTDSYIAIWNASTWSTSFWLWELYRGDTTGNNFTVNTGDVIRTYISGVSPIDFTMYRGVTSIYPTSTQTFVRTSTPNNRGYNYISLYWNYTDEGITLYDIATEAGMQTDEVLSWFNRDTYIWEGYIVGRTPISSLDDLTNRPVIEAKVSANRNLDIYFNWRV